MTKTNENNNVNTAIEKMLTEGVSVYHGESRLRVWWYDDDYIWFVTNQ
jgi:hypothetical protein